MAGLTVKQLYKNLESHIAQGHGDLEVKMAEGDYTELANSDTWENILYAVYLPDGVYGVVVLW